MTNRELLKHIIKETIELQPHADDIIESWECDVSSYKEGWIDGVQDVLGILDARYGALVDERV